MFSDLKTGFRNVLTALALAGLSAGVASAQYFGGEVDINLDTNSDEAVFAADANIRGRVGGDLVVFAAEINMNIDAGGDVAVLGADTSVSGSIMGDLAVVGADVNVDAEVMGDLGLVGADVTVSSLVGGELGAAGAVVTIEPDAIVNSSSSIEADTILAEGRFVGAAEFAAEDIVLSGQFDGPIEVYAASVEIASDAVIAGPITVRSPNPPVVGEGAQVGAINYVQERFERDEIDLDLDLPVEVLPGFWAFAALYGSAAFILGLFIAILFPRSLARMATQFRARPFVSTGLGLILWATAWMLLVILAILMAITVIGVLLIPFILGAIPVVYFLSYIFGGVVVGDLIFNHSGKTAGLLIRLVSLLAVMVVIAALHVVPPIGLLIGLIVSFIGFGAWALTIFNRHNSDDPEVIEAEAEAA